MTVNWNGRTFGQLTPEERKQVTREAVAKLEKELNSAPVQAAIQKLINTQPEN